MATENFSKKEETRNEKGEEEEEEEDDLQVYLQMIPYMYCQTLSIRRAAAPSALFLPPSLLPHYSYAICRFVVLA
jgi:hypothetical protein